MVEKTDLNSFVRWEDDKTEQIVRAISAFMNILTIDETGKAETSETLELNIFIRLIIGCLIFPDLTFKDWDIKYGLIYKSAFQLKQREKCDILQFQIILANEVKQFLSRPINQYKVIFPLHVSVDSIKNFQSFEILETRLEVQSWRGLKNEVDLDTFLEKAKIPLKNITFWKTKFTPILVLTEGRDVISAFDSVERNFDLFRIILNMLSSQYHFVLRWGRYPKPLSVILQSPVYGIFKSNGELEEVFYALAKYQNYDSNKIDADHFEVANKLAGMLRKPVNENESVKVFIEALELYGLALDTQDTKLSFIYFWQILEKLTLKSSKVTEKEVINRVCKVLQFDQINKDYLNIMYQSRNSLIHENIFPNDNHFSLNEVSLLKKIIDDFIGKMFDNVIKYPAITELLDYYKKFPQIGQ